MERRLTAIGLAIAMVFIAARGDDGPPPPPPPPPPPGDSGTDAADADASDASDASDSSIPTACNDPSGPTVEILAPLPAADPNTDAILTSPSTTVVCRVTESTASGAAPVDTTSVVVEVVGPDGMVHSRPMVDLGDPGTFEAVADLTELDSGRVSFRCTARDLATPPRCAGAEVSTFVDRGPSITILSPMPDEVVSTRLEVRYPPPRRPAPDRSERSHPARCARAAPTAAPRSPPSRVSRPTSSCARRVREGQLKPELSSALE